jgi:hypothetical protein
VFNEHRKLGREKREIGTHKFYRWRRAGDREIKERTRKREIRKFVTLGN